MHHLSLSISAPSAAAAPCAYFRAFIAPSLTRARAPTPLVARADVDGSSLPLRSLLMTTIIIRKSTFPSWVSLRRYGRTLAVSPSSLPVARVVVRIIGYAPTSVRAPFREWKTIGVSFENRVSRNLPDDHSLREHAFLQRREPKLQAIDVALRTEYALRTCLL